MTRLGWLGAIVVAIVLSVVITGGAWWYLFGPNEMPSDELVPANTIAFASIPDAADLLAGYQGSQLKTLLENPNVKPIHDIVVETVGRKNLNLLHAFLPNLSGQSFIAVTHFDYDRPEQIGFIAAMRPKAGLGDFGTFLDKLKAAYPEVLKQGKTGTGNVEGVDYDWIQGPGAHDKICVAHLHGWIVTTWGEAPLADWIERIRKTSTTSSLADDVDYRKSLERIGDNPTALVYVNYHAAIDSIQKALAQGHPVMGNYLAQKFATLGGAAVGTSFENGEIIDRFSFLIPRPDQLDLGMTDKPCPFETLRYTGPDTRFYWAAAINWKQIYQNFQDQARRPEGFPPMLAQALGFLQNWTRSESLDPQRDVIDPLGTEVSVQAEWPQGSTFPVAGLFVKVDDANAIKPAIAAIVDSAQRACAQTATVRHFNRNGQDFAALEFRPPGIFSPTITADGSYVGVFLTETQATRSFSRDSTMTLAHNTDFSRQLAGRRHDAAQIAFLDSPYLFDRAYRGAQPYIPFAIMFNKDVARWLGGRQLPDDLTWLAPMGTWLCVVTPDDAGVQAYSASGIGNQGAFIGAGLYNAIPLLRAQGYLPRSTPEAAAVVPQQFGTGNTTGTLVPQSTWTTPTPTTGGSAPPAPATNGAPNATGPPPASANATPNVPSSPASPH